MVPPGTPVLQAVSDAHTHLFEERERLVQLAAENDQLRLQLADRGRHEGGPHPRRGLPCSHGSSPALSEPDGRGSSCDRGGPSPENHHHPQLPPPGAGASIDALTSAYEVLQLHCEALEAQLGQQLLDRVKKDTVEIAKVESEPRFEGRQIVMVLAPK